MLLALSSLANVSWRMMVLKKSAVSRMSAMNLKCMNMDFIDSSIV